MQLTKIKFEFICPVDQVKTSITLHEIVNMLGFSVIPRNLIDLIPLCYAGDPLVCSIQVDGVEVWAHRRWGLEISDPGDPDARNRWFPTRGDALRHQELLKEAGVGSCLVTSHDGWNYGDADTFPPKK